MVGMSRNCFAFLLAGVLAGPDDPHRQPEELQSLAEGATADNPLIQLDSSSFAYLLQGQVDDSVAELLGL